MSAGVSPLRSLVVWAIRGYQKFISPGLPRCCKYYPSCSQYAIDALTEFGVVRGSVLAAWRLLRCNPLSYGGYDPVGRQKLFGSRAPRGCGSQGEPRREGASTAGAPACVRSSQLWPTTRARATDPTASGRV